MLQVLLSVFFISLSSSEAKRSTFRLCKGLPEQLITYNHANSSEVSQLNGVTWCFIKQKEKLTKFNITGYEQVWSLVGVVVQLLAHVLCWRGVLELWCCRFKFVLRCDTLWPELVT